MDYTIRGCLWLVPWHGDHANTAPVLSLALKAGEGDRDTLGPGPQQLQGPAAVVAVPRYELLPSWEGAEACPSPSFPSFFGHSPMPGPGEGLGQVRCRGAVTAGAQPARPTPAAPPAAAAAARPRGGSVRVRGRAGTVPPGPGGSSGVPGTEVTPGEGTGSAGTRRAGCAAGEERCGMGPGECTATVPVTHPPWYCDSSAPSHSHAGTVTTCRHVSDQIHSQPRPSGAVGAHPRPQRPQVLSPQDGPVGVKHWGAAWADSAARASSLPWCKQRHGSELGAAGREQRGMSFLHGADAGWRRRWRGTGGTS